MKYLVLSSITYPEALKQLISQVVGIESKIVEVMVNLSLYPAARWDKAFQIL